MSVRPALVVALVAFVVRVALIVAIPENYSMDAYQRWAGREHLLVQAWLPATQSLLFFVDALGGGILVARLLLSAVAALACGAGASLAAAFGTPRSAWLFLPVALFSPFLTWSTVPYQEGTFLALLLGGLALALREPTPTPRGLLLADLVMGGLALVRYEGWPVVLLYVAWRRDLRAGAALWGMGLWALVKSLGLLQPHLASPIDYADWAGLSHRFDPADYLKSWGDWAGDLFYSGALLFTVLGAGGVWLAFREGRRGVGLLVLIWLGQLVAVAGWMAGLETATLRMQVVSGVVAGIFGAAMAGRIWDQVGIALRSALGLGILAFCAAAFYGAYETARISVWSVHWEVELIETMESCEGCVYLVKPRARFGTRNRHDACEVLQGLGGLVVGRDFFCETWDWPIDEARITHEARWKKGGYVLSERGAAAPEEAPDAPNPVDPDPAGL